MNTPSRRTWTLRQYLVIIHLAIQGIQDHRPGSVALASDAVASAALAHPEWDLAKRRTLAEWEATVDLAT